MQRQEVNGIRTPAIFLPSATSFKQISGGSAEMA